MPIQRWTFLDYVDATGKNQISEWLRGIPQNARTEFEVLLDTLRPWKQLTRDTGTGILSGPCDGLFEFIFKSDRIQYRPLFVYGPDTKTRQITILAGATKKGGKLIPPDICRTALRRRGEIMSDHARVTRRVRI